MLGVGVRIALMHVKAATAVRDARQPSRASDRNTSGVVLAKPKNSR